MSLTRSSRLQCGGCRAHVHRPIPPGVAGLCWGGSKGAKPLQGQDDTLFCLSLLPPPPETPQTPRDKGMQLGQRGIWL